MQISGLHIDAWKSKFELKHSFISLFPKDGASAAESNYAYLNIAERGNLSSLQWLESPLKNFSAASSRSFELEIHNVHYAALCKRDILLATGRVLPTKYYKLNKK